MFIGDGKPSLDEIVHFGVLGMKWGTHSAEKQAAKAARSDRFRRSAAVDDRISRAETVPAYNRAIAERGKLQAAFKREIAQEKADKKSNRKSRPSTTEIKTARKSAKQKTFRLKDKIEDRVIERGDFKNKSWRREDSKAFKQELRIEMKKNENKFNKIKDPVAATMTRGEIATTFMIGGGLGALAYKGILNRKFN